MFRGQMQLGAIAVLIVVAGLSGAWIGRLTEPPGASPGSLELNAVRESGHEYRFIQPLLAVGEDASLRKFPEIEQRIAAYVETKRRADAAQSISVFFKDFDSSTWAGVDEDEKYALASMYKVVLMIALLKEGQTHPDFFSSQVVYSGDAPIRYGDESNTSPDPIVKGRAYTVGELVRRMIIYSDNNAKDLLYQVLDKDVFRETHADLGIAMPDQGDAGDVMSPKTYSLFFRVLYNSSYLSRSVSEQALSVLSQTAFADGIVAGVPKDVMVAHKFGFRTLPNGGGNELHDCGIVYKPAHPYLLCVMTRGKSAADLRAVIQDISRMVYEDLGSGVENQ